MRLALPGTLALLVCLLLVGCGEETPSSTTLTDQSSSAVPQTVSVSPTVASSGWMISAACDGVTDARAALDLVYGGDAVALVEATVTKPASAPTPPGNTGLVPVTDVALLSGDQNNGVASDIEVSVGVSDSEPLPPGRYVLLLGASVSPSTYYLADGNSGSFEVHGSDAYQRCWRTGVGDEPDPILEAIVDGIEIDTLARLFDQAFATARR